MDVLASWLDRAVGRVVRSGLASRGDGSAVEALLADCREFCGAGGAALSGKEVVWAHGASVGEVKCLLPIIRALSELPGSGGVLFSYTSPDGLGEIRRGTVGLAIPVITCPLLAVSTQALEDCLSACRLRLLVVAEGDAWSRMLTLAKRCRAPALLVDGRFIRGGSALWRSVRSFQYRRIGRLFDAISVGTREDLEVASSFIPRGKLHLTGPGKALECIGRAPHKDELRLLYRKRLGLHQSRPVVIIGSAVVGEIGSVVKLVSWFHRRYPQGSTVIGPRYVRKAEHMSLFLQAISAIGVRVIKVSELGRGVWLGCPTASGCVILIDEMGLLAEAYSVGDVAVLGGTFAKGKGHNMLEPIALGVPVVCGPDLSYWRGIARTLTDAGGLIQVGEDGLIGAVEGLICNAAESVSVCSKATSALAKMASAATQNIALAADLIGTGDDKGADLQHQA